MLLFCSFTRMYRAPWRNWKRSGTSSGVASCRTPCKPGDRTCPGGFALHDRCHMMCVNAERHGCCRPADAATIAGPLLQQQEQQQQQQRRRQEQEQTQPMGPGQQQSTLTPAAGAQGLRMPGSAAPAPPAKAVPLPALGSLHFAMGSPGAKAANRLVGDPSFDAAAYAAYQAVFDVPAGQYAPALHREVTAAATLQLPPEQSAQFAVMASGARLLLLACPRPL